MITLADWMVAAIPAAVTGLLSLWGVYASNRKSAAVNDYRMEQIEKSIGKLEQKQDKHNQMIERMYSLEGRMTEAEHDIKDLKQRAG